MWLEARMIPALCQGGQFMRPRLALLVVCLLAPAVSRATSYSIQVTNGTSGVFCGQTSATPIGATDCPGRGSTSSAVTSSDAVLRAGATLGVQGSVNMGSGGPNASISLGGTASFADEDVVITGPSGSTATSLNLSLHGSLGTGENGGFGLSYAGVIVGVTMADPESSVSGSGSFYFRFNALNGPPGFPFMPTLSSQGSGMLANLQSSSGDFVTPSISVSNGEHVLIGLSLGFDLTCGSAPPSSAVSCGASADYSNTFGFSQSGPVFNLPAGWTANSADGRIVANSFASAPEPFVTPLALLSCLGLASVRRRA